MVVLCLRFRTGTQVLIYFPVLLQISSVTLGQLLWEKHVETPTWLTNPGPHAMFQKGHSSRFTKGQGWGNATPKITVCCPVTLQLWAPAAHRAPGDMGVFRTSVENEQEIAWKGSATGWLLVHTVEQEALGAAATQSFQLLLNFH